MKTILLSFQPYWFNKIMSGEKIFEYRWQFPKEEVCAFLYVSRPVQKIVGFMYFGQPVLLSDWKSMYEGEREVLERINRQMVKNRYVMPIKGYQMTKDICLQDIKNKFPKVVIPQSYYYLDNFPELFNYVQENAELVGGMNNNSFLNIQSNDICKEKYN